MYSIFRTDLHELGLKYLTELKRYLSGEIDIPVLEKIQYEKLKEIINYTKNGSTFYQDRLNAINPNDDDNLSSFVEKLPFTTKLDLSKAGNTISSDSLSHAWIYYETTGTTGPSTPCPRNEIDSLVNNSFLTLQYESIFNQEGKQHIIGVMGPTELHSTGDTFEDVFRSLGHTVIKMWPRSPVVGMHRVLRLIQDLKITALVCTPAVAAELLKYCRDKACDAKELGIEIILVLGELITPNRLMNLSRNWGAKIYNCMYASQETSILAACNDTNKLITIPYNNYYELICPFTQQKLNVGDNHVAGELVITHLYKGNKPLIRYKTGDMVRCKAIGLNQWEIEPIGRVKDVLVLNNANVYAFDIENAIFEELEYCFEYFIEINNTAGTDELKITLEPCDELHDASLISKIKQKMESKFNMNVDIHVGDVGGLIGTAAMVSWKAARIHDLRDDTNNIERNSALEIMKKRATK
ncbi:phenylacetate--CoA ligase family protein [Photorhabdus akhurstii]|uniref:phenylacetate--CoA ligase family protein n=1 Tax=Photorhabdus akhurstii TaxID=171438 RepID=UPI000D41314D|nr:CoF synthetase [Photorhabdus luminescens]